MNSINNISSYLQSIMTSALENAGAAPNTNTASGTSASQVMLQNDNTQMSPLAQLMNTLQQLQQSNPTEYQQVTGQIAANLQSAAQTAQSQGNTNAANQLNQLAQDFTNASQNGQLPSMSDLAKAGGHHHHHHFHGGSGSSSTDSTSGTSSTTSTSGTSSSSSENQLLSQLFSNAQTNTAQSASLNPMNIIWNTLAQAGITPANS